ncbi:aminoglycoside phosphotransferase [Glycomyces endophyticus]|uniref:Aminoglycoside phosphotransferase n=1 Tax=Glycomyces endophyticus TaxID=480996 RepID=A0ABP4SC23_9ACTN
MDEARRLRALDAAREVAGEVGLGAEVAIVVHASNKLTLRLLPGDVLARVAPQEHRIAQFEIDLARRLDAAGAPVAVPDPRTEAVVHRRDGFEITLWTYYEPVGPQPIPADEYAGAVARLHEGMRRVEMPAPHFTDRVEEAQRLVADRRQSPGLAEDDRAFLGGALRDLRAAVTGRGRAEQLLHGEPHPGNLLATAAGPMFVDFETSCVGPVEFDLAHAPEEVGGHYPGVDADLLRECRALSLAMITAWRWDRDDRLPDGRRLGAEWMAQLRAYDQS